MIKGLLFHASFRDIQLKCIHKNQRGTKVAERDRSKVKRLVVYFLNICLPRS